MVNFLLKQWRTQIVRSLFIFHNVTQYQYINCDSAVDCLQITHSLKVTSQTIGPSEVCALPKHSTLQKVSPTQRTMQCLRGTRGEWYV